MHFHNSHYIIDLDQLGILAHSGINIQSFSVLDAYFNL